MKIIKEEIKIDKDLRSLCGYDNKDVLFYDIETTGFHRTRTRLYMIGYIYFENNKWYVEQHFADEFQDEKPLLKAFIELTKAKNLLISFNGDSFDLPYLKAKLERYCIRTSINIQSVDLYKVVRSYKDLLNLPNYKLKTIEKLVGIYREDPFTGGDLIEQYHIYMENKDHRLEYNLLLHNKEDMIALLNLMDIYHIFNSLDKLTNFKLLAYTLNDSDFSIELEPSVKMPVTLNFSLSDHLSLTIRERIRIKGNLKQDELKYFFSDYKNYFYIEEKDEAMHKSIANFLPANKRKKAKASNCYTKHQNTYLPLVNNDHFKCFKSEYKSKEYYTPVQLFQEQTGVVQYAHHVLAHLLSYKK